MEVLALTIMLAAHGGDLNRYGCHVDHLTGVCHCHRPPYGGCPDEDELPEESRIRRRQTRQRQLEADMGAAADGLNDGLRQFAEMERQGVFDEEPASTGAQHTDRAMSSDEVGLMSCMIGGTVALGIALLVLVGVVASQ